MTSVALAARDIRKAYTGNVALAGVPLTLRAGEIHAVMGENGSGKSTLLSILSGAQPPDTGTIDIGGATYGALDPKLARALRIGFVPQEPQLAPALTVGENLFMGRLPGRGPLLGWRGIHARAQLFLDGLGLKLDARAAVSTLATGRRQLIEIAKALVETPAVLLLDEATSSLDEADVAILFDLLRTLRKDGVAIGFVSHRMKEVMSLADRVTVLRDGHHVGTVPMAEADERGLVGMMVGRNLESFWHKAAVALGPPVLVVDGLMRGPLRDVSLTVCAGEIVGLAGLVGSGRSALLRTLIGARPAQAGRIAVGGRTVRIDNPRQAHELGIGYIPEDRKAEGLVMGWSVHRNAALSVMNDRSPFAVLSTAFDKAAYARGAKGLKIKATGPKQPVRELSGGNQQKVVLARELATDPKILLLDEPTRGVDVGAKEDIYRQMASLAACGVGILMASSELPELLGVCDRIYVLFGGRIVGEVAAADASEEDIAFWAAGAHEVAARPAHTVSTAS